MRLLFDQARSAAKSKGLPQKRADNTWPCSPLGNWFGLSEYNQSFLPKLINKQTDFLLRSFGFFFLSFFLSFFTNCLVWFLTKTFFLARIFTMIARIGSYLCLSATAMRHTQTHTMMCSLVTRVRLHVLECMTRTYLIILLAAKQAPLAVPGPRAWSDWLMAQSAAGCASLKF